MDTAMPASMQAVTVREPGGPDVLETVSVPVPTPGSDDVLIAVEAAGVNRPDILQREGRYPLPPDASELPGLEVAGRVIAVGDGVSEWQVGDAVMALTHGGGYAEYCVANAGHVLPIPAGLSSTEAAGLPETGFTVTYNVLMRAALARGEVLLVHGGSSGIGSMAIQLATALGSRAVTTAGTEEKCRFAEGLGAELAVNYKSDDWVEAIRNHLDGGRVDVVLDMVGGDYVNRNLAVLGDKGRYALIAFLRGAKATVDLRPLLARRISLTGSTLRPRTIEEKTAIRDVFRERAMEHIESGRIKPNIHATFGLANASEAHRLMESGEHMGKIVLTVDQ